MKRLLAALLAGAAVFSIAFASAAALEVNGNVIQAGEDLSVACDPDGVDANWGLEVDDNTVRNVRIVNVADACAGAEMWVQINGTDTYGPVVISGGQANFSFAPAPYYTPEEILSLRVWIEG
jgi:hypothetical protein